MQAFGHNDFEYSMSAAAETAYERFEEILAWLRKAVPSGDAHAAADALDAYPNTVHQTFIEIVRDHLDECAWADVSFLRVDAMDCFATLRDR